jgi:hypothetical protein
MKLAPMFFVFAAFCASFACANEESSSAPKDAPDGYSVLGQWVVTHPSWRGEIHLKADGTLVAPFQGPNRGDDPGRWSLTSVQGTPLLVIVWDHWGTESLLMVGPDYFRGQAKPGSFMEMRRGAQAQQ